MCPSAFAPSFVQEGLIGAIHMRPKNQCVKVASSFPNFQSWINYHDWMRVPVEATVKRLEIARLDQVYAGPVLIRIRGKGKRQTLVSSPLGRDKADNAVMNFAAASDLARRKQS